MITVSYIFPIVDKIEEIILTFLEMIKGQLTIKITKINCQIAQLQEEDNSPITITGFAVPKEEEDKDENI